MCGTCFIAAERQIKQGLHPPLPKTPPPPGPFLPPADDSHENPLSGLLPLYLARNPRRRCFLQVSTQTRSLLGNFGSVSNSTATSEGPPASVMDLHQLFAEVHADPPS